MLLRAQLIQHLAYMAVWASRMGCATTLALDVIGDFGIESLLHGENIHAQLAAYNMVLLGSNAKALPLVGNTQMHMHRFAHVHLDARWLSANIKPTSIAQLGNMVSKRTAMTMSINVGSIEAAHHLTMQGLHYLSPDILTVNYQEASLLTNTTGLDKVINTLMDMCPYATVLLKLGIEGVVLLEDNMIIEIPSSYIHVVDTTGYDDVLLGVFIGHCMHAKNPHMAARLAMQFAGWKLGQQGPCPQADLDIYRRVQPLMFV